MQLLFSVIGVTAFGAFALLFSMIVVRQQNRALIRQSEVQSETARLQIEAQREIARQQLEAQTEIARQQADVQLKASKLQFNAEVLSRNRQEWINTLRDELSEFVSYLTPLMATDSQAESEDPDRWQYFLENVRLIDRSAIKVELLLNAKEPESQQLSKLVEDIGTLLRKMDGVKSTKVLDALGNQIDDLVEQLVPLAQTVLKAEWVRVKNGE